MNARSHLSIGEVLSLLQQDFPDVTISKIRFLESQGLLDPERTPSGYRKFYDNDIDRLRWILRQQRENFLPLKVIKDRLAAGDVDFDKDATVTTGSEPESPPDTEEVVAEVVEPVAPEHAVATGSARPRPAGRDTSEGGTGSAEARPVRGVPAGEPAPGAKAERPGRAEVAALLQEAPAPRSGASRTSTPKTPSRSSKPLFDTGETSVSLTLDELMGATGLSAREVGDLERFGMLASRSLGSTTYYDENALLVARLAATFRSYGVEARHLRMYKVAAEREAGVFEQLLLPLSRKRGPQARKDAGELVNELAELGDGLRSAMLRMLLRDYLDGS